MAKVRQRNGTYFVDYRLNGRRFRKVVGPSKRIADLACKDIEVKVAKGELGFTQKDNSLEKLFDEFLTYSKTNHAPNTQKRYRAILDNFKSFLGQFPYLTKISHLSNKLFEDYKTHRKNQGAANKTINIELQMLRAMFYKAVNWGYAPDNPVKGISQFKDDKNKKPRFLSKTECKILLDNCGSELYPIFYTFLNTGMRKGELENLEWNDVDFERRKIKIRVKDDWSPKTSEREIPINNGLVELLQQHREKIEPNILRKKLISLAKKCGLKDVTKIHTLRHTFASHFVMSGVDLPTVKKLMGHSDLETTMINSHLAAGDHVDKAVEKLKF